MTKPGHRGSRYTPRGKAYAPRSREAGISIAAKKSAPRGTAAAQQPRMIDSEFVADSNALSSVEPNTTLPPTVLVSASSRARAAIARWQPRQSVALPVAMTIAALALMQQFPAYKLQAGAAQSLSISQAPRAGDVTRLALITGDGIPTLPSSTVSVTEREKAPLTLSALPADDVEVRDVGHLGAVPLVRACVVSDVETNALDAEAVVPEQFGSALAGAAEAQTREFVVYDDKYRVIRYPGGDVATLYGVCTDVVVRAYRALGVDLQRLVHESHVGSGDTNISHRRVEALRRYFRKAGASVAITDFAEDYVAGDVVTYHRPQNSGSNDHIAIVSNVTGPSGKPMIVHNRGFGPQVEDALFVNEITGHFRYRGPPQQNSAPLSAALVPGGPQGGPTVATKAVTRRVAQRSSHRMRNSVIRKVRRAAAIRAASGTSAKPTPKL